MRRSDYGRAKRELVDRWKDVVKERAFTVAEFVEWSRNYVSQLEPSLIPRLTTPVRDVPKWHAHEGGWLWVGDYDKAMKEMRRREDLDEVKEGKRVRFRFRKVVKRKGMKDCV